MRDFTFVDDPDFHPGGVTEHFGDVGMSLHRSYDPDRDGWRQHMLSPADVPSLQVANDIIALVDEVNFLRRKVWELEHRLKKEQDHIDKMMGRQTDVLGNIMDTIIKKYEDEDDDVGEA